MRPFYTLAALLLFISWGGTTDEASPAATPKPPAEAADGEPEADAAEIYEEDFESGVIDGELSPPQDG